MSVPLGRAGTAILVAEGSGGPEVLMMRRPAAGSFADAWVFPGGGVEDVDHVPGADIADDARRAAARETREEVGIVVDPDQLSIVSRWDPPPTVPRRFRTWFFVAEAERAAIVPNAAEVVAAEWIRPEDALARHGRGELVLVTPTWVTLDALSGHASPSELVRAVAADTVADAPVFASRARRTERGTVFLWEPDVAFNGDTSLDAPGPRRRLVAESLPWRYVVEP